MKFKALLISLVLFSPSPILARSGDHNEKEQKVERKVPADPNVTVSICIASGTVNVRGWDKNEVLARSDGAVQIQLKRKDSSGEAGQASRLEVLIGDKEN